MARTAAHLAWIVKKMILVPLYNVIPSPLASIATEQLLHLQWPLLYATWRFQLDDLFDSVHDSMSVSISAINFADFSL
jgi:hypothetical protein